MKRWNIVSYKYRVQNKWLWDQYYHERWKLEEKNNGRANELEYFHGTSETEPALIYNGEEGFDMRFSSAGYWGKGIYFAQKGNVPFHIPL